MLATDFEAWPGTACEYDSDGNFLHSARPLIGQLTLVGLVLTYAEIRALLAGLTQKADVSRALAGEYFRAGRGLALVLAHLLEQGGRPQAEYVTAFWRLFYGACVRAVTDVDIPDDGKLYVAKRVSTGHVALASGAGDSDGDAVIGLFARPCKKGALALIVTAGGFLPITTLPAGKLYRAPDATLKPYAQLADGSSTTFIGIASSIGLDVRAIQAEEVDQS